MQKLQLRKLWPFVLALSFMFLGLSCSKTNINKNADVSLTFICGEENINITLTGEEAEKAIEILNGNRYNSITSGIPSCGFNKDISLKFGSRVFAIACDTCNCIQDLGNLRYFDIPQEDMEYIHALFEKYGGYFPCN